MSTDWSALDRLLATIDSRKDADPATSYVAKLLSRGRHKIAQKLGEEGVETALAAVDGDMADITSESADLLFHLMVLWADAGIDPADVLDELDRRAGASGLDEKAGRKKGR